MGIGELFKKKKVDFDELTNDHRALLVKRSRLLIDELVSPLSQPNQQLIDELLTIISQAATLPAHMVNRTEVLKTTKTLLFQLIKPIPNPNKKLIDELLLIITKPEKAILTPSAVDVTKKPGEEKKGDGEKTDGEEKKEEVVNKQAVQQRIINDAEMKKQKTVMNLILQQIKELIGITNNLNSKIKSFEARLEGAEVAVGDTKDKNEEFDKKLQKFEKNMEKFIGLYEVVTNQFNPFIESSENLSDLSMGENQRSESQLSDSGQTLGVDFNEKLPPEITKAPDPIVQAPTPPEEQPVEKPVKKPPEPHVPTLELMGEVIKDRKDLEEHMINVPIEEFDKIKPEIINWVKFHDPELAEKLAKVETKKDFVKTVMTH